jgi:broad specificity phosphatase PhoE
MAATTLILVRHAHVADNDRGPGARLCGWFDPPVSAWGLRQLDALRDRLPAELPVTALYTSPLQRARATADAAAEVCGLDPIVEPTLREIHCGGLDGMPLEQVKREFADVWKRNLAADDPHFRWPGGESYAEFRERALAAVQRIAARHAGSRVVVVTHAGVIGQVIGAIEGESPARWDLHRPSNCSLTELHWNETTGVVVRFDDAGALAAVTAEASRRGRGSLR